MSYSWSALIDLREASLGQAGGGIQASGGIRFTPEYPLGNGSAQRA
jgi:hypothetical protein